MKLMIGKRYIDIHTHRCDCKRDTICLYNYFLDKTNDCPDQFCSIGLHPWHSDKISINEVEDLLFKRLENKSIIAIGETGLDYHINASRLLQKKLFAIHIKIAQNKGLPIILHCVKAFNDCIKVLKDSLFSGTVIFHAFQGNISQIKQSDQINSFYSIGHRTLHLNPKGAEIVSNIPLNRLFIETDEHDISIKDLYLAVAEIKKIELDNLKFAIEQNFKNVFGYELVGKNRIVANK